MVCVCFNCLSIFLHLFTKDSKRIQFHHCCLSIRVFSLIDIEALPYVSFVMVILPSIVSSLLKQQHLIVAWEIVRSCVIKAPLFKYLFFPQNCSPFNCLPYWLPPTLSPLNFPVSVFLLLVLLNDVLISFFVSLGTIIRHFWDPLGYIVVLVNINLMFWSLQCQYLQWGNNDY